MPRPQSWNRYIYVLNNPLSFTDPTGREADPGEYTGANPEAVEFVKSLLHIEVFREAFTGFTTAPHNERAMAVAAGAIALLDVGSLALAPEEKLAPKAGAIVIGHFPQYLSLADKLGSRAFNIPIAIYKRLGPVAQWAANKKFLDRAIARGAEIILATDPARVRAGSELYKEISYLMQKGYRLMQDTDGLWKLVKL